MAKVCQISGKKANNAKHIRHKASGQWKFRAPKKNRVQNPNLQITTIKTPHGRVRIKIATSILKSEMFAEVLCGLKPMPKEWLVKATYGL